MFGRGSIDTGRVIIGEEKSKWLFSLARCQCGPIRLDLHMPSRNPIATETKALVKLQHIEDKEAEGTLFDGEVK